MLALIVGACAAPGGGGGGAGEVEIRTGRIEQITMTEMKSNHDAGLGRSSAASRAPALAA